MQNERKINSANEKKNKNNKATETPRYKNQLNKQQSSEKPQYHKIANHNNAAQPTTQVSSHRSKYFDWYPRGYFEYYWKL